MTVIRNNSISGINSITAQSNSLQFYDSTGNTLSIGASVSGNITGNVTGNLTGNVTGPGNSTFDGSVGIGTDNPQATLHLFGSGGAATGNEGIRLQTSQATGGNWISFNDNSRKGYFGYKETSDDGIYLVNEENSHIVLGTNGSERFRIASDGALGIAGANYGTSGQVLTSQGSSAAPQWATISTGLGAASSGSVNGQGAINRSVPSGTQRITIVFYGVSTASGSGRATVNLGQSSGIIYSGYKSANVYINAGNGIYTQTDGWVIWNPDAGISWSGTCTLTNTDGSSLWAANWTGVYDTTSVYAGGGTVNISNVTQVEFGCLGIGQFDGGTVGFYFE